jgi:hypothetical protein
MTFYDDRYIPLVKPHILIVPWAKVVFVDFENFGFQNQIGGQPSLGGKAGVGNESI